MNQERRFELSKGVARSRGLDCSGSLVDEEETSEGELDAGDENLARMPERRSLAPPHRN